MGGGKGSMKRQWTVSSEDMCRYDKIKVYEEVCYTVFLRMLRKKLQVRWMDKISFRDFKKLVDSGNITLRKYEIDNERLFDFKLPTSFLPFYKIEARSGYATAPSVDGWMSWYAKNYTLQEYYQSRVAGDNSFALRKFAKNITIISVKSDRLARRIILDGCHRLLGYMDYKNKSANFDRFLKRHPIIHYEIEGDLAPALFPFDSIHQLLTKN